MKKVAICSMMRAGEKYETAYYMQILGLYQKSFEITSVNILYDRIDPATEWLRDLLRSKGIIVNAGVESPSELEGTLLIDKVKQWAMRGNECFDLALKDGNDYTHIAWIEADLCYPYDTLETLITRAKPIIAPLIYLNNLFYDSWGFRNLEGEKMKEVPIIVPHGKLEPVRVHSVGSFVLFDIAVFKAGIRFKYDSYEHGLLVGMCEDAATHGMETFYDPELSIFHPCMAWRDQMLFCEFLQIKVGGQTKHVHRFFPGTVFGGAYDEFVLPYMRDTIPKHFYDHGEPQFKIERVKERRSFFVRADFQSSKVESQ